MCDMCITSYVCNYYDGWVLAYIANSAHYFGLHDHLLIRVWSIVPFHWYLNV